MISKTVNTLHLRNPTFSLSHTVVREGSDINAISTSHWLCESSGLLDKFCYCGEDISYNCFLIEETARSIVTSNSLLYHPRVLIFNNPFLEASPARTRNTKSCKGIKLHFFLSSVVFCTEDKALSSFVYVPNSITSINIYNFWEDDLFISHLHFFQVWSSNYQCNGVWM